MARFQTVLFFAALATLTSCVTSRNLNERHRVGVRVFDPKINLEKPVATADFSGWHLSGKHTLIGVLENIWVVAYDLKDSKVLWFTQTNSDIASALTVSEKDVFLGLRDGKYLRLDAKTGAIVWTRQLERFVARPARVVGERVFVISSGQQLYALRKSDGTPEWIYDAGFPEGLALQGAAAPVVVEDNVYIGLANGELLSINTVTGKPVWREASSDTDNRFHDVMGDIAFVNGRIVFARYDGQVAAYTVNASSGLKVWEDKLPSVTAAVVKDDKYMVATNLGDVVMYKADSGKKLWTAVTGTSISGITLHKDIVYASGSNGRINAIDAKNGKLLWTDDVLGRILSGAFLYRDAIYFPTGYKNIYGYQL